MIKRIVRGVLVLSLLFLGGVSWFFSQMLMYPGKPSCHADTFVYCTTPKERGLAFASVRFPTIDGLLLAGWWIPASLDSKRTIVISHGRGSDKREGLRFYRALHEAGFHVFAFDYRRSGESQGHFNSMGYYERKDLVAALAWIEKTHGSQTFGIFGASMGASTAIQVMAVDPRLKAGIFEGGFADPRAAIRERGKVLFPWVPSWPFVSLAFALYTWRSGIRWEELRPEASIARITPRPLLIIHGQADRVVLPSHGERLFRAAGPPKEIWRVPQGRHIRTWQIDPRVYEKRLTTFFSAHLPPPPTSLPASRPRETGPR